MSDICYLCAAAERCPFAGRYDGASECDKCDDAVLALVESERDSYRRSFFEYTREYED